MRQHAPFLEAIRVATVEHGLPASEIAALAGLKQRTIERHLKKEGLEPKSAYAPVSVRRRFALLAREVLPKMEAAARELTNEEGEWNKGRLETMTQLSRLLDRFGELAVTEDEQQESAKDRDEQTAAALRKIDDRIVELAEALARRMVGQQS